MPRITNSAKPNIRICTYIYVETEEYLSKMSRSTGVSRSTLIKEILHEYVVRIRDEERRKLDQIPLSSEEKEKALAILRETIPDSEEKVA